MLFHCLCYVSVSMICPLMRVECWSFALLLYGVHCVLWALEKFLLWMWMSLHLKHRCSELSILFGRFFSLMNMKCPSLSFLITLGWQSILFDVRMATPAFSFWDHLLGELFSSLLLWGSVCLCHCSGFPVCRKMVGSVYISSLLAYFFLLGNWVHWS